MFVPRIQRVAAVPRFYALRCWSRHSSSVVSQGLRRKRQYEGKIKDPVLPSFDGAGLAEPFQPNESDPQDYLKKASLSPWVPVPDAVARSMLDMADASEEDIHVDLGSGDGRVSFHALDGYGVQRSVGIDVDEAVVEIAEQRRSKRHPVPDNLQFIVADLLEDGGEDERVWDTVRQATVITMYFAKPALEVLRPRLERKLVGCKCRIVTCGYEMPGWQTSSEQVVLGMSLYRYDWGSEDENESVFTGEDILSPEAFMNMNKVDNPMENKSQFAGANVIDHTGIYPIHGYSPDLIHRVEDDDEDWDASSSSDEDGADSDVESDNKVDDDAVVVKTTKRKDN